ncbi:xanthine dehydrogenase family protein molybdopterin-binding subunit [Phenylobacterium sp. LjRoot225]|uniref:xanthine dehydrogenase family protein molybdopterin-binding subunit n=1 Tax=Phenylobacterium sp. LjRoot225 TaxID=3342285 RepID=UPI003ED1382A
MNAPPITGARFIGQRMARKEDGRLLTGRGAFVDDVVLAGMLHVAFVRSTIARGRIKAIDVAQARAAPGVWAVYTAENLAPLNIEMISTHLVSPPPGTQIKPLAYERVAYVGDPIALVIAESRYLAEDAAGLVAVDYEAETPVVTLDDARAGDRVHPDVDSNVAAVREMPGDAEFERILASAPHVVTRTIKHQRISHSPMETRGVVVSKQGEGELTVYIGCQGPQVVARWLSMAFGLPQTNIRVISKDVGGSFGLKAQPWREEAAVIAAGLILGRPLKWIEDRIENLTSANQAREQDCVMRVAFDGDGRLLAAHADYAINNGAYPHYPDANAAAMMFLWAAYKLPRLAFRAQGYYSNTVGLAAYRGPWAMESLARETVLDIAARQMGIDAIELRRRNLVTAADQPYTTNIGLPLVDVTPAECLEALLKKVDVPAFRAEQAAARAEGRYLGLGIATYIEPTATSAFAPFATELAQVRIEPTGKVTAVLGTHSQGQGTQTTMAQVVADRLGVRFEDVSVFEDDSSRGGYGGGAGGSRQAVAGGGAAIKAAELLLDKVKHLAAHLLNANPDDVRIEAGMVHVAGVEEVTRSLREIAEVAYNTPGRLPPDMEPGLEAQFRYHPPMMTLSSAAHACIVEVDPETGLVKIRRWVCSEDCGVVINPAIVEGQIAGGLAQAIGGVLFEDMSYDDQGNPTAVTFKDYMLPTSADVPEIEYTHIVTPSQSVGGFRGVGEGGAIIGPPTLVNAIADALAPFGELPLELPLTPSKIMKLIEGGPGRTD